MSELQLHAVGDEAFSIEPSFADGRITVKLLGSADGRALPHLEHLAPRLHDEVVRLGVRDVVVDVTTLAFMTTSCMRTFVTWVGVAERLEPDRQYRIRFVSNPEFHWQRRSLHALARFAADLVSVD